MKTMTIIGSGLAGTLLSLYMVRRGYEVELFEARPDLRVKEVDQGRSINLALSCRGITGLAGVNLMQKVKNIMVPMRARAIHLLDGEIKYQAFGRHKDEYINAILRNELNELLLNNAESYPGIRLHFNTKLVGVNVHDKVLYFEEKDGSHLTKRYQLLIGADGAASNVREILVKERLITATREFLPHGYKELSIAQSQTQDFVPEHLHLWPRESFMLLGNPNRDRSITGTLFLAKEGKNSFAHLEDEDSIRVFFKEQFSDAYQAMPSLITEFMEHPIGNLSTIKCTPWYYEDQCLLIGDAAHGIVPFFGQGMNSAFEDCRILDDLLNQYDDNWRQVIPAFYASRKVNTDAVAAMSMDNYHEIQTDIRDEKFNLRKQMEQELMHRYPGRYVSKHVLVMFTNTPYAIANAYGEVQAELLTQICKKVRCIKEIDWNNVDKLMEQYDKKLANLR
ncbi:MULTISPECIES: FAD-dependent oxidoreductase [Legionella]|uniref:Kynurenine 3-monooxygenase n=1 Tax=Legionella maceachernii TaxID=466 RepID=A0A0W0WCF7_9GAMM|nr:NAD(P)/FAD-dependent oxidoreductase [Legionella maceachernii]KTD30015.1 kynurenine 3-monooxygenase [Legionella maceachernii]SKA30400.1 kynurenine 3-monooxygenase [Legionella maceachernii]SUP01773.1 Kynurenine 3-monooxygenase [Legionella maceachernii]